MYKEWKMDFVGALARDEETPRRKSVFINSTNSLQFYIKIISAPPENFPRNVEIITGFCDEDMAEWGFIDEYNLSPIEREDNFGDFINRHILIFTVEMKNKDGKLLYKANNFRMIKKADTFKYDNIMQIIPVFSQETTDRTQEVFEEDLVMRKFIGDNKQISTDEDDTPSLIAWYNEENDEYTFYGPFQRHEHAFGGFRFDATDDCYRKINLPDDIFLDYINENAIYLDGNLYDKLWDAMLFEGMIMERKEVAPKEIPTNKKTNNISNQVQTSLELSNDEDTFMKYFEHNCKQSGLYYDVKDLYNFHTAMKTGSLVVLAGMSGTGKSKLVQCYVKTLKLQKSNYLFASIRPSYLDDSDLIGFLDVSNNVYRPGDSGLLNILIHAKDYPEELHLVCFDEMNIARVEHYFSQFLSVLEIDEPNKRILQLYNDEYNARIYNQHMYPSSVRIGNNIMFVGTVNLDESTYHFSDKVLDRANVINLNILPYDKLAKMEESRTEELAANKIEMDPVTDKMYNSFKKKEKEMSLTANESDCLWKIHVALQECNRNLGVGWRIVRQISSYLVNLPVNSPLSREEAFDIQLVQRILTKVRGSEEQFTEFIGAYNTETKELSDSKILDILAAMPSSYEFPLTKKMIKEKARELRLYGHTI